MKITATLTALFVLLATSTSAMAINDLNPQEARLDAWLEMLNEELANDSPIGWPMAKRAEGAFSPAVMSRHLNLLSRYGNGGRFGGGSTRFGR